MGRGGEIIVAILLFLVFGTFCTSILTDDKLGFSLITKKVYAEEKSTATFDPKYPAGVIYGFVEGCYLAFEDQQFMSGTLWPDDLKEICGCVMDGIREAVPAKEFIDDWNVELTPKQSQMSEMFGMICTDRILKERLNKPDPI